MLHIRMWDYWMVTIYRYEVERTNMFCRNNRSGTSNQGGSRFLRSVHGMHEMLSAHISRMYNNRGALLMLLLAGQCLIATALAVIVTVSIALSD